jgi:transglutaminase-like putative cysteine protease
VFEFFSDADESFLFAGLMMVATIALLTTQLSFQYIDSTPSLTQRLKLASSIVGLALPLMLVLFFLFPRIQGPLWGLPSDAQSGRSGMSETMAPGNIAKLALSDDIAFRVQFLDPLPARTSWYWRGVVLGHYDGRTWSRAQPTNSAPERVTIVPRSTPLRYRVTLEATSQRWLYALDILQRLPEIADNRVRISADLQLVTNRPITERVRYDMASAIDFELQPDLDPIRRQDWLDLPPGFNPETHAYAARLRNQSDDNNKLISTVLAMFRTQPFRYTLEPPPLGKNAVDDFLFETKAGFCEHYASAFVVLMRALDIPARVVTGYQGGQLNPVDGYLTVRQSDAHAWAEVWLDQRGWVRIDPTAAVAPERIERSQRLKTGESMLGGLINLDVQPQSWLFALRQYSNAFSNGWNQWILNYTPERQRTLLQSIGLVHVDWTTLTILMIILSSGVMLAVAGVLLWRRTVVDPVDALYQRLCQKLAKQGLPRSLHEGPRSYAHRITTADTTLTHKRRDIVQRFMAIYETARYAKPVASSVRGQQHQLIKHLTHLLSDYK